MTGRPKILVVDDDHDTLDLLEIILYKKYEIATAMNGFEALSKVKEVAPALILTDIMMPVMDGIRLFNNLRNNSATRSIPVVAITSFTGQHPEKSLTNMGFAGVIVKPAEGKAVIEMIDGLVNPASQRPKDENGNGRQT